MPGVLRDAVGAHYLHFTNLRHPVEVSGSALSGDNGSVLTGAATGWADELIPDDATVLARYAHPHLKSFAAITTNTFGAGRVTYVGTVPDRSLSASLARWLADTSLPADPWRSARPESVTCTASVTPDGRVVRFLHNWNWNDVDYVPPVATRDLISGAELDAGEPLRLTSWDVRVLVEAE
jgi:beta-galactosidase